MQMLFMFSLFTFFLLIPTNPALAHSGCCSHHDGVRADGCGCNDGTPLSSTCAPYYACTASQDTNTTNSTSTNDPYIAPIYPSVTEDPTYIPPTDTPTPLPTATPTKEPTPTLTNTPTLAVTPTAAVLGTSTQKGSDTLGFLTGIGIVFATLWGASRYYKNTGEKVI